MMVMTTEIRQNTCNSPYLFIFRSQKLFSLHHKSQFQRNVQGNFVMFLLPLEVTNFSNKLDIGEGIRQQ